MDNADWMDMFKIKASFGQQGNDNVGNYYPWADQYQASGSNGLWSVGPLYYKGNPLTLHGETSNSFNVGVDFAIDQLAPARYSGVLLAPDKGYALLPPDSIVSATTRYPMNIGSMPQLVGRVSTSPTRLSRNKNIDWTVSANVTYIRNKVLKLTQSSTAHGSTARLHLQGRQVDVSDLTPSSMPASDPENGNALYWPRDRGTFEEKVSNWSLAQQGDGIPGYMKVQIVRSQATSCPVYGGVSTNIKGLRIRLRHQLRIPGRRQDGSTTATSCCMYGANNNDAGIFLHKDILNAWTPETATPTCPHSPGRSNQAT